MWAVLNETLKTITFTPTAQSDLGIFQFNLIAEFKDFTSISNAIKVTVEVLPACLISSIVAQDLSKLQDLTVSIQQPEVLSFELPEYKDQISLIRGDPTGYTLCGPRVYTLITTNFARQNSVNPKMINILSN